jgi:hypothetical protein
MGIDQRGIAKCMRCGFEHGTHESCQHAEQLKQFYTTIGRSVKAGGDLSSRGMGEKRPDFEHLTIKDKPKFPDVEHKPVLRVYLTKELDAIADRKKLSTATMLPKKRTRLIF